jgi:hypothetical protein
MLHHPILVDSVISGAVKWGYRKVAAWGRINLAGKGLGLARLIWFGPSLPHGGLVPRTPLTDAKRRACGAMAGILVGFGSGVSAAAAFDATFRNRALESPGRALREALVVATLACPSVPLPDNRCATVERVAGVRVARLSASPDQQIIGI